MFVPPAGTGRSAEGQPHVAPSAAPPEHRKKENPPSPVRRPEWRCPVQTPPANGQRSAGTPPSPTRNAGCPASPHLLVIRARLASSNLKSPRDSSIGRSEEH